MKLTSILFLLLIIVSGTLVVPITYAEEDDYDEDRIGLGEMKREREHQDEGIPLGTEMGNVIFYGTIAAIVASVAYTAFKISSKKKAKP